MTDVIFLETHSQLEMKCIYSHVFLKIKCVFWDESAVLFQMACRCI